MGIFFTIALRNLLAHRRRTALLGLAIAAVTLLLVLVLALSQGLRDAMVYNATAVVAGHINIGGFYKVREADQNPMVRDASRLKEIVREHTPDLDLVIDRVIGFGKIVGPTTSFYSVLAGVDMAEERRFAEVIRLAHEHEYRDGGSDLVVGDVRRLAELNTIVLFASQAKRLGVGVDDTVTITTDTSNGSANAVECRVVAIARDIGMMSSWNAFMNKESVRLLYDMDADTTGSILIYLRDIEAATPRLQALREVLAARGYVLMDYDPKPYFMKFESVKGESWEGQKLDLTTWADEVSYLRWILTAFDGVATFLLIILAVIIGVGILNATWIAVRERTREIGTSRAIGMSRPRVLLMLQLEAAMLGLTATGLGGLTGALIAHLVTAAQVDVGVDALRALLMSDTLVLASRPGHVIGAMLLFTFICCLAALPPALRAARLEPVRAIQQS